MGLLLLQGASDLNPRELFANGEQGLWLDPSQMSTLYQDSNGVTPCTAAGDPVGLILDQSRGGLSQIGADLVTNGTFAADTDWTKGANWTIGSGVATKTGGAANNLTQTIGSTAAAWYRISLDVTRSAGTLTVSLGTSGTTYAITATGSYTFFILAGSGTQTLTLAGDSSFAGTVDNVVVRNVPGNHAYQTTSGQRPTLARIPSSGRRNLLTRTEEFDNAAWTVNRCNSFGAGSVANTTTAPDGTNTADYLQASSATRPQLVRVPITWALQTYTFSVYAKQAQTRYLRLIAEVNTAGGSSPDAWFDLQLGASGATNRCTSAITSAGNGWYRCSITFTLSNTTPVGSSYIIFELTNSDGVAGGTIGEGLYLWGAGLELGTLTNYQKVVATTDVTESGFGDLWHLVFDGSDDSLVTNSVDFSATDEMTVIAGVRKLSDAGLGAIVESTANALANAGAFYLYAPISTGASGNFGFYSRGSVASASAAISPTTLAPVSSVLTGVADISSDQMILRLNAVQSASNTEDQGSGNYGNYQLFIGRRNQASFPYNGHLYQLIIRGKTTPTGKLLEAERFVARKTGVTGI